MTLLLLTSTLGFCIVGIVVALAALDEKLKRRRTPCQRLSLYQPFGARS